MHPVQHNKTQMHTEKITTVEKKRHLPNFPFALDLTSNAHMMDSSGGRTKKKFMYAN